MNGAVAIAQRIYKFFRRIGCRFGHHHFDKFYFTHSSGNVKYVQHKRICSVCGAVILEKLPSLGC
jgi:hypothetical protein